MRECERGSVRESERETEREGEKVAERIERMSGQRRYVQYSILFYFYHK